MLKQIPTWQTLLVYSGLSLICIQVSVSPAWAREITFCGEIIPVNNSFVANKLMNVIRQQMPYANMPGLRRDAKRWFPYIEYCLRAAGMPQDLKYIPIVESGFRNATSSAGAQGFWQFTEETAIGYGLRVTGFDERNDPYKSTIAALRKLANDYKEIRRKYNVTSWALAAAAYNCGLGCIYKKIKTQGGNYFTMTLNAETALYVYKIIAIKELFEYPELYIKNFQYNVFRNVVKYTGPATDAQEFQSMDVKVAVDEKAAPNDKTIEQVAKPDETDLKTKDEAGFKRGAILVGAQIVGKYRDFEDGDAITIELLENLQSLSGFHRKGSRITGKGWIIDDRVHIDLGFNSNNVILYDTNSEQGVDPASLKKGEQVILRVQN
jgi:membrane-bound lytic murein transglycosylase D